jgi:hypothetical protein
MPKGPIASWFDCVGAPRFKYVDGQKPEGALWVTIANERVRNIGPILQGLACSILSRIITAINRLDNTLDDVDHSPNGVSVKRSYAMRWIGHLNDDKFPTIAGQWKTFENLTCDIRKSGLLGACLTVDTFSHWTTFSRRALYFD